MQTNKYVVAYRTHVWDEATEVIYRNLEHGLDQSRWQLLVLADETKQELNLPEDIIKISHTSDLARFGYPDVPQGRALWRNGDYAMAPLREQVLAPGYIIVENDTLIIGRQVFEAIADFFDQGGEFVTARFNALSADSIPVRNTALGVYESFHSVFVWLWGGLAPVMDKAIQERAKLAQEIEVANHRWPTDEVFLGHFVHQGGYKMLVIDELEGLDSSRLNYRPAYSLLEAELFQGEKIVHPVVAHEQIFTKYADSTMLLADNGKRYDKGSHLWQQMQLSYVQGRQASIYNAMVMQFMHTMGVSLADFGRFAADQGFTYPGQLDFDNQALWAKTSASSSISGQMRRGAFSRFVTDGNLDVDKYRYGGFASRSEHQPWLMIELPEASEVSRFKLYHREGFFERTKHITVSLSQDGEQFETVADLRDMTFVKTPTTRNKQGYCYVVEHQLVRPKVAKFVKLTLETADSPEMFNLNQVEIF